MPGACPLRRLTFPLAAIAIPAVAVAASLTLGDAASARATTKPPKAPPHPGTTWQTVSPASVGLDAKELDSIAATAKKGKSNCLVVVRDGKVAGQWYFNGTGPNTAQNVWSVTKSFASTLVGIAQDDGDLRVGDKASTWIPTWTGTRSDAVTVQDLLSMISGRQWSFFTDYVALLGAADRTKYAVGLGQSNAPGTTWTYNNAGVQTLEQILQQATGHDVAAFAEQRLFRPLGMTHTHMTRDRAGNPQLFEGIRSTCLDLARFGQLMLDEGTWGGAQVVSSSWVEQATGRSSSSLNAGYGYLWWINHKGRLASPFAATSLNGAKKQPKQPASRIVPGAPVDMYWALGLGNQVIQVDPGTKTVVVRLGSAEPLPRPPTFGPVEASKVVTKAVTATSG
jgi:CubicO group peptidase (beta-lactamase class C family)